MFIGDLQGPEADRDPIKRVQVLRRASISRHRPFLPGGYGPGLLIAPPVTELAETHQDR